MSLGDEVTMQEDIDLDNDLDVNGISRTSTSEFDKNVGLLEDIIVEDSFTQLLEELAHKYFEHFEDNEDNKLEYTKYFNEYTHAIENYIQKQLQNRVDDFDIQAFLHCLEERKEELKNSDVFDLLSSLTDFQEFKSMMLSYKQNDLQEGIHIDDFLTTTKIKN